MDEWIHADEIIRKGTDEEIKKLQEKEGTKKRKNQNKVAAETPNTSDKEIPSGITKSENSSSTLSLLSPEDDSKCLFDEDCKAPAYEKMGSESRTPLAKSSRSRGKKRKHASTSNGNTQDFERPEEEHDEHEGMDAASIREHEEVTKVKNVRLVEFGRYRMAAWYFSPFPKEFFPGGHIDCFCLAFFCHKSELQHHQIRKSCDRHPPGNEIYRHENLSVFEVDGAMSKFYCQNLCYFAKLFLDHKTLYYDVDPFLFYIVCEVDTRGFHPVGYFSKEKYSELGYNLACILTIPCHQRKGYGNFIIQFSYELSKKEGKVGSPEKPLSDLGLVSYRSYWTRKLLFILKEMPESEISIMELTKMTSIKSDDIISTLQYLNIIRYIDGQYVFLITKRLIEEQLSRVCSKGPQVHPEKLHWTPLHLDIKRDKWSLKSKFAEKEE
uniref:histone acetyltransferase n=1 Tax=Albugo laibachii Nc14 TaxID=890382 RepID=F0WX68_9STRA|nr:unnamed protein product [Albugo laibachii Nc14]|eukprot:CCA26059.1 unnamed protein product [Albugo laibachii Nc14]